MDPRDVTAWLERYFDETTGLLRYPSRRGSPHNPYQRPGVPIVRESATFAVALLERGRPGDLVRAEAALDAVLDHQLDRPGSPVHGTFLRSPREPIPGEAPREWIDYDPNWREFLGCALILALAHERKLTPALVSRVETALRRAAEGSVARAVGPEYTNIALMAAFLLDVVGDRLGEADWRRAGLELAEAVAAGYRRTGAFAEHNSPTYYGTDLFGLGLWRARAASARLRELGAEIEAALWRDLARFYHAGLRNLCGPYTRAYGMDMNAYVAGLGCWIAPVVGAEAAPLPRMSDDAEHAHDFADLVWVDVLGSRPPPDVVPELSVFAAPRTIEQTIVAEPRRMASARLEAFAMWGGEHTSARPVHWQHHPATIHWRRSDGALGWVRLVTNAPVDAVADPNGLGITVHTGLDWLRGADIEVAFEFSHEPEPTIGLADGERWGLAGLEARLQAETACEAVRTRRRVACTFPRGRAPRSFELALRIACDD